MTDILTPSQTSGPLFGFALIEDELAFSPAAANDRWVVTGRITDGSGAPLVYEAFVEIWSEGQAVRARALDDGRYRVELAKPREGALPDGRVLAPHLHVAVFARGLSRQLVTRMYFPDEETKNRTDPVLAMVPAAHRPSLVARSGSESGTLEFDIVIQGENETPFFRVSAETREETLADV
jgi:protocatechuate 3,4-dioxygenase alpha subunit